MTEFPDKGTNFVTLGKIELVRAWSERPTCPNCGTPVKVAEPPKEKEPHE